MEKLELKVGILPNQFLKSDGTFDKDKALLQCGKIAGVFYDEEEYAHLGNEPEEKTMRRVNMTLNNGHHSVYDHISISFNIQNIPKILAMVLNNEEQYTTSEKLARYIPVVRRGGSSITLMEEYLYNKWIDIFKVKIKEQYGDIYNDSKIQKLAQENARYLVTVFMPTQMIYIATLRQINYIVSWMERYINDRKINSEFEMKLSASMIDFIVELDRLNVLIPGLMKNEKHRSLSLFGHIGDRDDYFGIVYSTTYKGTFAQLAQVQGHRKNDYQMEMLDEKEYFVPPIIANDAVLVDEWLLDMKNVSCVTPQGEMVKIRETGTYDKFILKCKERLCSAAQLEVMMQTRRTLKKYRNALKISGDPLYNDILGYTNGARCTFPDYECSSDCKFKDGKMLVRKI